jgi:hypothetical protein
VSLPDHPFSDFSDHAAAAKPTSDPPDARHIAIKTRFHRSQGKSSFGMIAVAAAMSIASA